MISNPLGVSSSETVFDGLNGTIDMDCVMDTMLVALGHRIHASMCMVQVWAVDDG